MSGYREIVTTAPTGPGATDVLRVAELLALRFSAHVYFVHGQEQEPLAVSGTAETETDIQRIRSLIAEIDRKHTKEREAVEDSVEQWRRRTGLPATLAMMDHAPEPAIWRYMLTADIAVLPRPGSVARPNVENVLLEAGRPAILALGDAPEKLGERIAIFWRCTPPTSHAVAAAMPLLREAEAVALISVDEDRDDPSLERADAWLKGQGVNCEIRRERPVKGASVGAVLVGAAGDFDADLIVMGAYGHSRLREWALGGVTRHVLHYSERPVLACH